jgi:hypothetical protein
MAVVVSEAFAALLFVVCVYTVLLELVSCTMTGMEVWQVGALMKTGTFGIGLLLMEANVEAGSVV